MSNKGETNPPDIGSSDIGSSCSHSNEKSIDTDFENYLEEAESSVKKRKRDQKKVNEKNRRETLDRVWDDLLATIQKVNSDLSKEGKQLDLDGIQGASLADSRQNKMSNRKELIQCCLDLFQKLQAENAEKDEIIKQLKEKIASAEGEK